MCLIKEYLEKILFFIFLILFSNQKKKQQESMSEFNSKAETALSAVNNKGEFKRVRNK